ncbi:tRNA-splicing ligase RtcB [Ceratobasidium sp. AG-Ba]|nr:tRNA-splicing ligase RtcB [Ceratobasidium sp. AG-Ba]
MPSTARPITVILNANQSKKFVFLLDSLPSDVGLTSPNPQHTSILVEARKKFRVKPLDRIYLKGGTEFSPNSVEPLHEDVREVWVSKGEPFAGRSGPAPGSRRTGARVDVIAEESYVDPEAVKQLKSVAELEALGMPDLHPGNRFPIGCAVAARGIYPALIGTDIGCGIALYRLASIPSRIIPSKIADQLKGLDDPWDGDVRSWLAERIDRTSNFDASSLGTFTLDPGLGKSILEARSQSNPNPFYAAGTPELEAYVAEHDYAVQWARANRTLLLRIAACLGVGEDEWAAQTASKANRCHAQLSDKDMLAVPADNGVQEENCGYIERERHQPIWALLHVLAVGEISAGCWSLLETETIMPIRLHMVLETTSARRSHLQRNIPGTTTSLGSEVVCTDPALMKEERPEAYKSVEAVVNLEARGVAKGVAVLRPVVTYKVRSPWPKK